MAIAYQDFNKFIKFIFVCYCIYRNKNQSFYTNISTRIKKELYL